MLLAGLVLAAAPGCIGELSDRAGAEQRAATAAAAAGYAPVGPSRVLDTRSGPRPGAGATTCVAVAGRDGVPADARAVAVNVTAVEAAGEGFLSAYPAGSAQPGTSTLNYAAGQTVANSAIVQVGSGGKIRIFTHAAAHVLVDVSGYFGAASSYAPLAPYRRLDTRGGAPLGGEATRCEQIAGRDGVPDTAKAVAVNLTAVSPTGDGYLATYPDGSPLPGTSTANYAAGQTVANGAIVQVGSGGRICIFSYAATHLLVDVSGYFDADSAYSPLAPYRRIDTRGGALPGAGSTECVQVAGRDGVPGEAGAVAVNLTAVSPTAGGYLVAYPGGRSQPGTSTLNFAPGMNRANNALVAPGADGTICIFANAATHYLLDVVGYWAASAAPTPPPTPPPAPPAPPADDGCFKWSGGTTLQDATNAHACVEVQAGTFVTATPVIVPAGHTIRGKGRDVSTITVPPQTWKLTPHDAVIGTFYHSVTVRDLTIDGQGVATYGVGASGMTIDSCIIKNMRCSAVGIAKPGMVVRNTEMVHIAHHTHVPGRADGHVDFYCGMLPPGVELGGAIYSEAQGDNLGSVIENNVIHDIYGPALDVNGAWGGTFRNNKVFDIVGWAAVGLYGASYWTISGNEMNHAPQAWTNVADPYCEGGPGGKHSAAIWLCEDSFTPGLTTNYNRITDNIARSYYGILVIGADEREAYKTPRVNVFHANDVFGLQVGCADDLRPGQWYTDDNVWSNNNCQGTNTPPLYF